MSPPGQRRRPAGNGAAATEDRADFERAFTVPEPAANRAASAPVPLTESAAGSVTSELRQALGSLLWSVHTIRRLIEKARDRLGAAERLVAAVEARGGSATIYRTDVGRWSR